MPDNKSQKSSSKKSDGKPRTSNDQLGENAGEGRLMKDQGKKDKKKS